MPARRPDRQHRDMPSWSITTGSGTLLVSALDEVEAAKLVHAWSRCHPTRCDAPGSDLDRAELASLTWEQFHEELVHRATTRAIESGRGTHLMFHAACLAAPGTGAAVVLVAASGTGKTTATRTLGPHYGYVTDETAIVHPEDLTVIPFPKPLSLLGPSGRRPKAQVGPDAMGLGQAPSASLRRICVLDRVRQPGEHVTARAEAIPLVEALAHLVPQTSSLSHLPRGLVALCRTLDRLGGAHRLVYTEAADLLPLIDGLLTEQPVPVSPSWTPLDVDELAATPEAVPSTVPWTGEGALVRRRGAQCGIRLDDGRLALLMDQQLVVLAGLGPEVWLLLHEPRTVADLLAEFTAGGETPDGASDMLDAAVRTLCDAGVLTTGQPGWSDSQ